MHRIAALAAALLATSAAAAAAEEPVWIATTSGKLVGEAMACGQFGHSTIRLLNLSHAAIEQALQERRMTEGEARVVFDAFDDAERSGQAAQLLRQSGITCDQVADVMRQVTSGR